MDALNISEENLKAVKAGMLMLTTQGSVRKYFQGLDFQVGAKTGSAQVSANSQSNAVFVCFAPYENPEIAVAVAIEKGGSGSALASTAVKILNAYFSADEIGTAIIPENQLLP